MKRFLLKVFLAAAILPALAQAVVVEDLYEVEVPVMGQHGDERTEAIRAAFTRLLVRLTGNPSVLNREEALGLLDRSAQFVQQYRYRLERAEAIGGAERQLLQVTFDPAATDQALWKSNLPVWGRTRPATLVWLAAQEGGERYLVDPNRPSLVLDALKERARDRGIPLVFPLLDLEDRFRVNVSDVWANFNEPIMAASRRYATEAVLVGRLFEDVMGGWQARWMLYEGGEAKAWSVQGADLQSVVGEGLDGVANALASRYASLGGSEEGALRMAISDVTSTKDYVRASKYLASLTPVESVQVEVVEPARITFLVQLRGSADGLQKAIRLGSTLAVDQVNVPEPSGGPTLAYRLLP